MDDCCKDKGREIAVIGQREEQRRVLLMVLAINALMFVVEFTAGVIARSSALMADSVDMLGDAFVYVLSLVAVHRGPKWEAGAALAKGLVILLFGVGVIVEVAFKVAEGVAPSSELMTGFGGLALAANLTCLALLWRFRTLNVNMSSTFECSRNDVIANVGVLVAAGGVYATHSAWPDILVGLLIAALFLRSAWRVLAEASPEYRRR